MIFFGLAWRETSILKLRMIVSPGVPGNAPDKWQEYGKRNACFVEARWCTS